ncbi:addiction module toxin RelE [Lusitaniella coriacea LEGE 07157]|uniref:Addiction module toxin RelE n=1 Tax=Lusitaniella coriacea LEGE 07157 TaxID=945747 RepID=A0A8J7E3U5_9CYAN|nr:addiction module toxin RelE [Lusitaniella coriacea]MBE9119157.1 addiction module toxin RelE [Lusitaniella coriacea LEGE 07157]
MFEIEFTQQAKNDLRWFKKYEQNIIVAAIGTQLRYEPTIETNNRFRLRENPTAEWELRIEGKFRAFYNANERVQIVEIQRIGAKRGNQIFFQGEEGKL